MKDETLLNKNGSANHRDLRDDIAVAAGVSTATVSRVLNNVESLIPVGEATRERVLKAAIDGDHMQ